MNRQQLVEETIEYYSRNERSYIDTDTCLYNGGVGKQCAVARCILHEYRPLVAEDMLPYGILQTLGDKVFRPEYQGFPSHFWTQLQLLHDTQCNWVDYPGKPNVLTRQGEKAAEEMIEYDCGNYGFQRFIEEAEGEVWVDQSVCLPEDTRSALVKATIRWRKGGLHSIQNNGSNYSVTPKGEVQCLTS